MSLTRIAGVVLLVLHVSGPLAGADWQGRESVEDGVLHIRNPERPIAVARIEPAELWRRGGADDELVFGSIAAIRRDPAGSLYVLDSQNSEIYVFSAEGERLRTVGREGEGPGEFRGPVDMFLGPDNVLNVLQMFPPKIVRIDRDGTPREDFPLPEIEGGFQQVFRGKATSDRILLAGGQEKATAEGQKRVKFLRAFSPDGKELAHYHDEVELVRFDGMEYDEKSWGNLVGRWSLSGDGRVAAVLGFDAYRIHVSKPDGTRDRIIERPDYVRLERSAEVRKATQERFDRMIRWNAGSTIRISATHRTIQSLWYRPGGELWVMASRGRLERSGERTLGYDVFDAKGRYVRRVWMKLDGIPANDGFFFEGDGLYRVTEEMELVAYSMEG